MEIATVPRTAVATMRKTNARGPILGSTVPRFARRISRALWPSAFIGDALSPLKNGGVRYRRDGPGWGAGRPDSPVAPQPETLKCFGKPEEESAPGAELRRADAHAGPVADFVHFIK